MNNNQCRLLEQYESLQDPHLAHYFSVPKRQRYLRKVGLMKRNGSIVTEMMYRLSISQKDDKQRQNEALRHIIVDKRQELKQQQEALVLKTIDEISKREKVMQIKNSRKQPKPASTGYRLVRAPATVNFGTQRINSAPTVNRRRKHAEQMQRRVTADGRFMQLGAPTSYSNASGTEELDINLLFDDLMDDEGKDWNSHSAGFRHRRQTQSPYRDRTIPSVLLRPRPPAKLLPRRHHHLVSTKQSAGGSCAKQRGRGKKKTGSKSGDGRREQERNHAQVIMRYYGTPLHLECDRPDRRDDVIVEQQHCGGNTLHVFNGKLAPGEEFSFESRRHSGYPFSVTIYVNGKADCRLSACCEYRHRAMVRLGSKGGHFGLVSIHGGAPCFRCKPKYAKAKALSHSMHDDQMNSSSDADTGADDMLYIPVESDDEIKVRSVDSYSSYSSDSKSSYSRSGSASSSRTRTDEDDSHKVSVDGSVTAHSSQNGKKN